MGSQHIDLNCDLGEYDDLHDGHGDAAIMPFISSCNIACGGHAGNEEVMAQSVQWAKQNQLRIGAHPSYPDRLHFGRQAMNISGEALVDSLKQQITAIKTICQTHNIQLSYVKPHGALYNMAANDYSLSALIIDVIQHLDPTLRLMGLAHSQMQLAALQMNQAFIAEGFADRKYTDVCCLQARCEAGAVIEDIEQQIEQALSLCMGLGIKSHTGKQLTINCQSLCLHGDSPQALDSARMIHHALTKQGIHIHA